MDCINNNDRYYEHFFFECFTNIYDLIHCLNYYKSIVPSKQSLRFNRGVEKSVFEQVHFCQYIFTNLPQKQKSPSKNGDFKNTEDEKINFQALIYYILLISANLCKLL